MYGVLLKHHVYIQIKNTEQFKLPGTSEGYLLKAGLTSKLDQVALGLVLTSFKYFQGPCQCLTALTMKILFWYIWFYLSLLCLATVDLLLVSEKTLALTSPSPGTLCAPAS